MKRKRKRKRTWTGDAMLPLTTTYGPHTTVEPGRQPGTFDIVTVVFEVTNTGIYQQSRRLSETRQAIRVEDSVRLMGPDESELDALICSARIRSCAILGARLKQLSDQAPVQQGELSLDLGAGIQRYAVPGDMTIADTDALEVLRAVATTEEFLKEGGSASVVMRGFSLAFAIEKLRIRHHESAVRHARKATTALPAARQVRSAKSAEHRQWARDNYPRHHAAAISRKAALKRMAEEFTAQFPDAKPVTPRTIGDWVSQKRPAR